METNIVNKLYQKMAQENLFQDELELYIPARGSYTQYTAQSTDLLQIVANFLASDKKVLLLLGESGSGKSFFGQTLATHLANKQDLLPLFISLPALHDPTNIMQETASKYNLSVEEISELSGKNFLFILDAYDELHIQKNLYKENHLEQLQGKVIISCRPSYLATMPNYKQYFMPFIGERGQTAQLQEIYMAPFTSEQITSYIEQYLTVKQQELALELAENPELGQEWLESATYEDWINQIPGLKPLVQTPFLLKITMEVLPQVVAKFQEQQSNQEYFKMTGKMLYDFFVRRWFGRQEEKLIGLGTHPGRSLYRDYIAFAKTLALKMHQNSISQVVYEEGSDMLEEAVASPWAPFFSDEFILQDRNDEKRKTIRILARKGCPLHKTGINQYAFLHNSLLEYFFTEALADTLKPQSLSPSPANLAPPVITTTSAADASANNTPATQDMPNDQASRSIVTETPAKAATPVMPGPIRTPAFDNIPNITVYSNVSSNIPVTYSNWVISIMRRPHSEYPQHALLVLEGIDEHGKCYLAMSDLVHDRNKKGFALIKDKVISDIDPKNVTTVFKNDLMKQDYQDVYFKCWGISREQAFNLRQDIEIDQTKTIKYCIFGRDSMLAFSSSNSDGHSCFSWAIEKLRNINDDRIVLPTRYDSLMAAIPNRYITAEPRPKSDSCLIM